MSLLERCLYLISKIRSEAKLQGGNFDPVADSPIGRNGVSLNREPGCTWENDAFFGAFWERSAESDCHV